MYIRKQLIIDQADNNYHEWREKCILYMLYITIAGFDYCITPDIFSAQNCDSYPSIQTCFGCSKISLIEAVLGSSTHNMFD